LPVVDVSFLPVSSFTADPICADLSNLSIIIALVMMCVLEVL